ncbi:MAG: L-threonylcarbamoyladenylate synthase [Chlorobi bacterium]|nr:L-threonylcarbamoyladenylate synthase [Chlorobiota bacterium]
MRTSKNWNKKPLNLIDAVHTGAVMVYPADTVWGLGGNARDENLIRRILEIKNRPASKGLIVLVSDTDMLQEIVGELPPAALDLIEKTVRPTTIVYPAFRNLPALAGASDGSIAVRLVRKGFVHNLIQVTRTPLISTSANRGGAPTPLSFDQIDPYILDRADYIVNLHPRKKKARPSRIVKLLADGRWQIIRE